MDLNFFTHFLVSLFLTNIHPPTSLFFMLKMKREFKILNSIQTFKIINRYLITVPTVRKS